ncbi:MAG: transposase, partial [Opitutales bacterium]|nr:transposase [Opitutales bacterium]
MRKERLKIQGQRALYHVMSRTVNGEIFFSEEEKEVMRRMLFKVAGFCGVKVLTYCLMGNHFHVLVEVPDGSGIEL